MNRESVISFTSLAIALIAVFVTVWQGIETREYNKNSLKPYLTAAPMLTGIEGKNGIYVTNDGVGPAFIKGAILTVNGKRFDLSRNSWPSVYEYLGLEKLCHSESWFKNGSALKAGEKMTLLAPTAATISPRCPVEFVKLLSANQLELKIEYASVYDDSFVFQQEIGLDKQEIATFSKLLGI
ncbi:hypothetical protein RJD39_21530 [Vibrio scophthalmi]|uniref:hypothetical protein n=1 Tax=Vibrio scophthalmi TaxID=45658 RepID=UPI00387343BA